MGKAKIKEYLDKNGVPYTEPIYQDGPKLRVMDLTTLPASMRLYFDERGFYKQPEGEKK